MLTPNCPAPGGSLSQSALSAHTQPSPLLNSKPIAPPRRGLLLRCFMSCPASCWDIARSFSASRPASFLHSRLLLSRLKAGQHPVLNLELQNVVSDLIARIQLQRIHKLGLALGKGSSTSH